MRLLETGPSEDQVTLLRVTYAAFRESAEWPPVALVDAVLDREFGLDSDAVLNDIPPGLVQTDKNYASPSSLIVLSIPGLRFVDEAAEDLDRFLDLVRVCAEWERTAQILPAGVGIFELTRNDAGFGGDAQAPGDASVRAFRLVQGEGLNWGSSGPDAEGGWSLNINRSIRRYRDLIDLDDYLARRPRLLTPRWAAPPAAAPYAFVLMPFGERWSANVTDAIRQACGTVNEAFVGFRVERADEITEPGRITDQIISAIERADVLIADITGNNANVMFELGYGDALGKPIIVLNQSIDDTPFDIRDWRQIIYSQDELGPARDQLVDFLAGTLRRLGFARSRAMTGTDR